jgi:hypothetical protein
MWFFKRNRQNQKPQTSGALCTICGSANTKLVVNHGTVSPNYIRVWKGQRVLTYRCLNCGQDFYGDVPKGGITDEMLDSDGLIDDEEALRAAEEDLKKQSEEDDDRMCH